MAGSRRRWQVQEDELFNLGMNKFVPGVQPTTVGMKLQFLWYEKTIKRYEIE